MFRFDKNIFIDGLNQLQSRVETRFYVTTLAFFAELCEVVSHGINTPPKDTEPSEPRFEASDAATVKNTYADIRERRKLAKRLLRATLPHLETALRIESEISQKPLESLQKELEAMFDSCVDPTRPLTASTSEKRSEEPADDTIMVDATETSQITVKSGLEESVDGDAMDTQEDGDEDGGNIEVNTSGIDTMDAEGEEVTDGDDSREPLKNGVKSTDTPPDTDGYISKPRPAQSGPPTPPQSNGSLGQEPTDPLTEGGVLWYMKDFNPDGTSVVDEHWAAGRDAVRMLSEDLTDLDDEELKGLGADVDRAMTSAVVMDLDDNMEEASSVAKNKAGKARKRRTSTRRR